jgi:hypothetical protein
MPFSVKRSTFIVRRNSNTITFLPLESMMVHQNKGFSIQAVFWIGRPLPLNGER